MNIKEITSVSLNDTFGKMNHNARKILLAEYIKDIICSLCGSSLTAGHFDALFRKAVYIHKYDPFILQFLLERFRPYCDCDIHDRRKLLADLAGYFNNLNNSDKKAEKDQLLFLNWFLNGKEFTEYGLKMFIKILTSFQVDIKSLCIEERNFSEDYTDRVIAGLIVSIVYALTDLK